MSPPLPVRLGVLGCGWIAKNRLRQIGSLGLANVVAVADPDDGALEAVAEWAPGARRVAGIGELDARAVDGVMISTPSALHADQAIALLRRRLPVFVQKPVGVSATDVLRVIEHAARADVPLAADLCYRHLNCARAVRATLDDQDIGDPFLVEACFHNAYRPGAGWSHDPRLAGGGALIDLGLHLLDLVMWLMRQPLDLKASTLLSRGSPRSAGRLEDFATLDLQSARGVPVRITTSWDASTGLDAEIRLRIYGSRGNLEIANRKGSFFDFDAHLRRGTATRVLAVDDGDAWQAGPLREWLHCVAQGDGFSPPVLMEEPMAIIDAAYRQAGPRQKVECTAAGGTVHVLGRKGVVP